MPDEVRKAQRAAGVLGAPRHMEDWVRPSRKLVFAMGVISPLHRETEFLVSSFLRQGS